MTRFGGTSALLQKVNSTLKGEKQTNEEDDEGLGAYLSGLSKKPQGGIGKKKEIDWNRFGEVSDLSDEDVPKKKSNEPTIGSAGSKFLRKKSVQGKEGDFVKQSNHQKSSVLNKAMGLSSQYDGPSKREASRKNDSDMDLSFGLDEQILGDVESLTPAKIPRSRSLDKSGSEDSMSFGKSGSKFLKKQTATETMPADHHRPIRKEQTVAPAKKKAVKQQPFSKQQQQQLGKTPELTKTPGGSSGPRQQPTAAGESPQKSTPFHRFGRESPQKPVAASFDVDTDSSSMSLGKGGSKFMKKKSPELKVVISPKEPEKKVEPAAQSTNKRRDMFSLKSAEKYSTKVELDSEDESMQGFIQELGSSKSDVSVKTPPKTSKTPKSILKTPRTPRSLTPLDDIYEREEGTSQQTLSDDEDSFKINVLDLEDLDQGDFSPPEAKNTSTPKPGVKKTISSSAKQQSSKSSRESKKDKKKQSMESEEDDNLFAKMGLQTVDDLLGDQRIDLTDTDIGTDIDQEHDERRTPSPLRSILSPSPKPDRTPRSGRTPRVRYSLEEVTEMRSRSPSPEVVSTARLSRSASMIHTDEYEDDEFDSVVKTEEPSEAEESMLRSFRGTSRSESEYYSDDWASATESRWTSKRREYAASQPSESVDSQYSAYSNTFSEATESRKKRPRSRSHSPKQKRSGKQKEVEIQTGASLSDLTYKWVPDHTGVAYVTPGYGLGNVDPKLVASHVVSADALEVLSSYSPSVLALNDMLRQQLQLTENYLTLHKQLHESLVHSTQPDYVYTTLQDTKRYIKKHRKPSLTFDEALKQVKQEMGMS